jgi:tetratricopeptide (TPR) repeat protein
MAESLDALFETDYAIEQLRIVTSSPRSEPYGVTARAYIELGEASDRLGRREEAVEAYRAAIASAPADDPDKVRSRANERLRRRPDARVAEAYRLSLEGWRQLQRRELKRAADSFARSAALAPSDAVLWYRIGKLEIAEGNPDEALARFEQVMAARPAAPHAILAAANLEGARILEKRGELARALQLYDRASRQHGAEPDTRRAAEQSLARLRASK